VLRWVKDRIGSEVHPRLIIGVRCLLMTLLSFLAPGVI